MSTARTRTKPADCEPAWEIAHLFPRQGEWTDDEYLSLSGNRLVELSDGSIEVLPMPTFSHQLILLAFYHALLAFVKPRKLGTPLVAVMRVRLRSGKYREPDVMFMLAGHSKRMKEEYWEGADLVAEVVSGDPKDRRRDLEIKPVDYARAGIPEYWIIDPQSATITVLRLSGRKYVKHGEFRPGSQAASALLDGFEVDVDEVLSAS